MILREMLAIFGLGYKGDGQKKAEKGLDILKNQAEDLATAFSQILGAGAIAAPFLFLTKLASDANENLNLLDLAFGDNADAIVKWSNEVGPAMGRSRFTMRELAAEFGGLLQPMVGTGDALAEMSKGLAKLAVDLSSARNITENEALAALQSGLSGNIIAMKRFGSNVSAARVEAEALAKGINKTTQEMSQGELAAIRYDLIMKDLAFIQDDAAKTQFGFANSTRALRDSLKDIGTELGLFLIPAFESALEVTREILVPVAAAAKKFKAFAKGTNLAKAAIIVLSAVIALKLFPVILKLLFTIVPLLLVLLLLVGIIDDLITAFEGGNSAGLRFGKFLDKMEKEGFPGMSLAVEILVRGLNLLRSVIGAVMLVLFSLFQSLTSGSLTPFREAIQGLRSAFDHWLDSMGKWGQGMRVWLNALLNPLQAIGTLINGIVTAIATGSFAPLTQALSSVKSLGLNAIQDLGALVSPAAQSFAGGGGSSATASHRTLQGAGGSSQTVTVQEGSKSFNFEIFQQAGESGEDFAQRVAEIVDDKNAQRDQALYTDLVQTASP